MKLVKMVGSIALAAAACWRTSAPPPAAPVAREKSASADELKDMSPDPDTKTEMITSGKDRVVGTYKLCITPDGNISSVVQLKSTGFPAYDSKIQNTIRGWRYRPFYVDGRAVPVCTSVTFIYTPSPPPPPPPHK